MGIEWWDREGRCRPLVLALRVGQPIENTGILGTKRSFSACLKHLQLAKMETLPAGSKARGGRRQLFLDIRPHGDLRGASGAVYIYSCHYSEGWR
jgi:hypothetical protein